MANMGNGDIAADINKVLEIDVDTNRVNFKVIVRQVATVGYKRERQPDPSSNIKDDIVILVNALGASILKAESDGTCKKGEAMTRAIELLHRFYVDPTCVVSDTKHDKKGNKISK